MGHVYFSGVLFAYTVCISQRTIIVTPVIPFPLHSTGRGTTLVH